MAKTRRKTTRRKTSSSKQQTEEAKQKVERKTQTIIPTQLEKQYVLEDVKGIGPILARRLREAGITSVKALALTPPRIIAQITGLSESRAAALASAARALLKMSVITAKQLKEIRLKTPLLTTGCKALDELLGGGLRQQVITEFVGPYGSGKTQICHQLAVTVQLPLSKGGLEGAAIYIDTENMFSYERIEAIAKRFGLNPEKTLENIFYVHAVNSDHQIKVVKEEIPEIIEENNVRLLIVDSLINHFRAEYPGRENLAARQQKLNEHLHDLLRLAETYSLVVVVTNHVLAIPDPMFGQTERPAGGHVVAHLAGYRVFVKKLPSGKRKAVILDAPNLPEREVYFKITDRGVEDVED